LFLKQIKQLVCNTGEVACLLCGEEWTFKQYPCSKEVTEFGALVSSLYLLAFSVSLIAMSSVRQLFAASHGGCVRLIPGCCGRQNGNGQVSPEYFDLSC
jgi:hypothetical protein